MKSEIICGDCLEVMRGMADNSVDAVVTDPPYGLAFMGKRWDYSVPSVDIWREALRVLKPGGHLLSFAGTRTQHRMAVNIEYGGFEIRDMIAWVYGSGFPKSLDVSKAIDKAAGIWRGRAGNITTDNGAMSVPNYERTDKGLPSTDAARKWAGWGTALKPAFEPITVARKPIDGTVAENVLEWGTGGLNIDGGRVATCEITGWGGRSSCGYSGGLNNEEKPRPVQGRWPANFIHDGSEEVVGLFPSAARFFYCAKASKAERDAGCEGMKAREKNTLNSYGDQSEYECPDGATRQGNKGTSLACNNHPTIKPLALMRYLCRLITPPGGIVLDPFAGSGSTGCGAVLEGFDFIGIDMDAEYCEIARRRIAYWGEVEETPDTFT
jgi:DNA modification methylase